MIQKKVPPGAQNPSPLSRLRACCAGTSLPSKKRRVGPSFHEIIVAGAQLVVMVALIIATYRADIKWLKQSLPSGIDSLPILSPSHIEIPSSDTSQQTEVCTNFGTLMLDHLILACLLAKEIFP